MLLIQFYINPGTNSEIRFQLRDILSLIEVIFLDEYVY